MQFTFLCQSSLWIEHRGVSVLVDPWLEGTAYEGGWALLPEPPAAVESLARPHWIAYTHEHPDHFHVPTLKKIAARFGSDIKILVPQLANDRLSRGLAGLGFKNVVEAPLGRAFMLGDDFSVTVQAVRADDSLQVFRGGGITLVNANDCRLEGRLLEKAVADARGADFYFGQYSLADGYPYTFEGVPEEDAREASRRPLERFIRQSAAFAPRNKVPIASFVRFASADNAALNRWSTSLDEVRAALSGDPALLVLHPGDGWSQEHGVRRDPANEARYRDALAAVRGGTAPLTPREPVPERSLLEAAAADRFAEMFRKIPFLLRRRIGVLGFHLDDASLHLLVDWKKKTLTWSEGRPSAPHFRLGAGYFLKVCRSPWGWSNLHIGCRFTVHEWKGAEPIGRAAAIEAFLPASILYGMGYFDAGVTGFLRPRALRAFWRRRGEITDLAMRVLRNRLWGKGAFRRV